LEQMKVPSINQSDFNRSPAKRLSCIEPAKPTSNDYDAMSFHGILPELHPIERLIVC